MNLSPHFTLWEMCKSSTAKRLGLANTPGDAEIAALVALCENALEPIRAQIKKPIRINSGYRSPELNRAIGGSKTSQHCKGEAADLEIWGVSNLDLARFIRGSSIPFDQLILEHHDPEAGPNSGWVHLSHRATDNRGQVLTASRVNGRTVYARDLPGD